MDAHFTSVMSGFPFFYDVRGQFRPVAAADVLRRVDRAGRNEQNVTGLKRHRRLALDLILQRVAGPSLDFAENS